MRIEPKQRESYIDCQDDRYAIKEIARHNDHFTIGGDWFIDGRVIYRFMFQLYEFLPTTNRVSMKG